MRHTFLCGASLLLLLASCSLPQRIGTAGKALLRDTVLRRAHVGISVADPETGREVYGYRSDRYFVPASNTKLVTCYAAMKHLGDSLPALRWTETPGAVIIQPTGDPTLLHPDFPDQPAVEFLRRADKPLSADFSAWSAQPYGRGWNWDDYAESYMPERSPLPVYGNIVRWRQSASRKEEPLHPGDTVDVFFTSEPEVDFPVDIGRPDESGRFSVMRDRHANRFTLRAGRAIEAEVQVPFVTELATAVLPLLRDTLGRDLQPVPPGQAVAGAAAMKTLHSRPLDSLLRPLMHRSDNFFAEQALLMVAGTRTGVMDEAAAINALLSKELADMPHPPRWVDGSGLSRYNLFTPADFTWLLGRMRAEFGMRRLEGILPTPGVGTMRSYSADLKGVVYAKTGTLSGVVGLSGFVHTRRGRLLAFSVLVNHHDRQAQDVRRSIERFLRRLAAG